MQWDHQALGARAMFGFTMSITPAATAAASSVEQAFTVPSGTPALLAGDGVLVTGPGSGNNVTIGECRINSSGQLVIQFCNPTAGSLTHAAGTFSVLIYRV